VRRVAIAIATGLGVGFAPVAPATVASFVVALLLIPAVGHVTTLGWGIAVLALLPIAVWSSGEAEKTLGTDAKPIVIDEVVGMLVGGFGVAMGSRPLVSLALLFVLFRIFDIWKPLGIDRSQKLPGGWGVVVDDVLAGVLTNVVLRVLVGWVSP
jgi:phosphatidylglycerophosphatase A